MSDLRATVMAWRAMGTLVGSSVRATAHDLAGPIREIKAASSGELTRWYSSALAAP
jgi:hypothetical protein